MLHNGLEVDYSVRKWHLTLVSSRVHASCKLNYKHVTLANNILNNVVPIHIKMQNYHLKYPNVPQ